MSNDIQIVVSGTNRSDSTFRAVDDDLDKLKGKARETSVNLEGLSAEFAKATTVTDGFGHKIQSSGTFSDFLKTKISDLRTETHRLGEEFNKTGDASLGKKLFANQDTIKELENFGKRMVSTLGKDGEQAGVEFGKNFSASTQGVVSTPGVGPVLVATIAAAAVAAAPLAGAALNAGLLGALATGGLAVGIADQFRNPVVGKAFSDQIDGIIKSLDASTSAFTDPLIAGIQTLGDATKNALGTIDFSGLSKAVEPLAAGLGGLLTNVMPGLNKAMAAGVPIMEALASMLPGLGDALSTMFTSISHGGAGAADALRILIVFLSGMIQIVGYVIEFLSRLVEIFVNVTYEVTNFFAQLTKGIPGLGALMHGIAQVAAGFAGMNPQTQEAGRALQAMGDGGQLAADSLGALTDKLSEVTDATSNLAAKWTAKLFGEMMNLDQATLHWHESLTSLNETLGRNGLAIDRHTHLLADNTKAGEQNLAAILAAVQANEQQYQAMVAGGISATDAAKAYDTNTAALEKQLRAAGYTAAQVDDLIGKYRGVPDQVNTALAVKGLTEAINNLGALEAAIHGIDGKEYGFTITEKHVYESDYVSHSRGEHASGGIAGGLISMNEHGWEAVHLPQGSTVIPHGTSQNLLDDALNAAGRRGGDGASAGQLTLQIVGDSTDWLAMALREASRNNRVQITDSTGRPVTIQ